MELIFDIKVKHIASVSISKRMHAYDTILIAIFRRDEMSATYEIQFSDLLTKSVIKLKMPTILIKENQQKFENYVLMH